MTKNPEYKLGIMVTGETAGTGASTISKHLEQHLGFPIISGGKHFRALANHFNTFREENPNLSLNEQYKLFLQMYQNAFDNNAADSLMGKNEADMVKGDVLAVFHKAIEENYQLTGQTDKIWDYVVDRKTIIDAFSKKDSFIWESKLAILALSFDQMQAVVKQNANMTLPYLKVLLSLDPTIAAQRISKRENRPVKVEEILERRKRDFDRYGNLYQINGQKVTHQNLTDFADVTINTQENHPEEVVKKILSAYIQKLTIAVDVVPNLAHQAINELGNLL